MKNSLYADIINLKIEHSNHCSDLYIPHTTETLDLLKKHNIPSVGYSFFIDNITQTKWIDVFFAYEPYYKQNV